MKINFHFLYQIITTDKIIKNTPINCKNFNLSLIKIYAVIIVVIDQNQLNIVISEASISLIDVKKHKVHNQYKIVLMRKKGKNKVIDGNWKPLNNANIKINKAIKNWKKIDETTGSLSSFFIDNFWNMFAKEIEKILINIKKIQLINIIIIFIPLPY